MYYLIKGKPEPCSSEEFMKYRDRFQYIVVLTPEQWRTQLESFDLGIDMDLNIEEIHSTKAEVNYDSLTGTFSIPDRKRITEDDFKFTFVLDEKGIVFIDSTGIVTSMMEPICKTKKSRISSLERFLYDFIDQIIKHDFMLLQNYEREMDSMEVAIVNGEGEDCRVRINDIRGDIRDLRDHYGQLMELSEVFEENENNFFKEENLRYFRMIYNRVDRLHGTATALRDYTMEIRDLYKAQMDIKQNRIMTILTIVTTIFMPLTLIAGWYGMNFHYMPELDSRLGYPIVIVISLLIVIGSIIFFKRKKWL